ncbi:VanZ family protein [uncultured Algibacter sp.]|uniref:VanZ family protein n=1 Tax=uncultured Algibacter sp. TaxID=298659 RepID=UPI0032179002
MLKKIVFISTVLYTTALLVASLMTLHKVPSLGVAFSDKVYHFGAYFVLTLLWFATFLLVFKCVKKHAIFYAVILAVIFGIIIEMLQGAYTVSRAYDIYDMMANTMGALLASIILWFNKNADIKNS